MKEIRIMMEMKKLMDKDGLKTNCIESVLKPVIIANRDVRKEDMMEIINIFKAGMGVTLAAKYVDEGFITESEFDEACVKIAEQYSEDYVDEMYEVLNKEYNEYNTRKIEEAFERPMREQRDRRGASNTAENIKRRLAELMEEEAAEEKEAANKSEVDKNEIYNVICNQYDIGIEEARQMFDVYTDEEKEMFDIVDIVMKNVARKDVPAFILEVSKIRFIMVLSNGKPGMIAGIGLKDYNENAPIFHRASENIVL